MRRIGWRLVPAFRGGADFEINLDATRTEPADAAPDHGATLRTAIRW